MGSIRKIICPCGFKSQVSVGGTMQSFREHSTFPFYCEKCGMVEVNIAKDVLSCPICRSLEVKQYGIPPISKPPEINRGSVSWGDYKADLRGHLCPSCKNMTMEFCSDGEILFD